MKRPLKRFLILILCLTVFFETASISYASELTGSDEGIADALLDVTQIPGYPQKPDVSAEAIILIESKSKSILYSKNADKAYYPASITKVMTALLTIENCSLDEIVTFSYRATHELEAGSSSIARTEGEQLSVRECLYALLVASANEVAQALAEHISGSFEAFAELMNKRAKELGCTNTHFTNPSGLNDEQHYTTCHDMALIMAEAIKNPVFVEIDSTVSHLIPATNKHKDPIGISMKHELLKGENKYAYAVCGKTGYTSIAGFSLVTYATKDNVDLICVTLHCDNASERTTSSKRLFEYGFKNFTVYNIGEYDPSVPGSAKSENMLNKNLLSLSIPENSYMAVPNFLDTSAITSDITWGNNNPNIAADSGQIAVINYFYGKDIVGRANLTIDKSESDFAFLGKSTIDKEELKEEKTVNDGLVSALKIIGILLVCIVVITIIGLILYRFINGKSKYRKKHKTKISHNLRKTLR